MPNTDMHAFAAEALDPPIISGFYGPPTPASEPPHLLVDHDIGRELLTTTLRVGRPYLHVPWVLGRNRKFRRRVEWQGSSPWIGGSGETTVALV